MFVSLIFVSTFPAWSSAVAPHQDQRSFPTTFGCISCCKRCSSHCYMLQFPSWAFNPLRNPNLWSSPWACCGGPDPPPPCWWVMITLEEKKLQGYKHRVLSFEKGEHKSQEVLEINLRGQVGVARTVNEVYSQPTVAWHHDTMLHFSN